MGIRKRGSRWLVTVELGLDEHGVRRRKCVSCATEGEAKTQLSVVSAEVLTGAYFDPTNLTTAAYLERWLEHIKPHVVPATYTRYQAMVDKGIVPALGKVPLARLSVLHITRYEAEALASGRAKGEGGLSPTTVRKHHFVLKQALDMAVRWKLIRTNPILAIDPPRETPPEICPLSLEEQQALLAAAVGREIYAPVLLALGTGMRRGEILGLRWPDIDFAGKRLSVRRSLRRDATGGQELGPAKTHRSQRAIALPDALISTLAEHRRKQADDRALAGSSWQDRDLVFTGDCGGFWAFESFDAAWRWLKVKASLERPRFHDLRHTHATELLRAGVPVKVVSERLGHANISTTLNIYAHVLPDMQDAAALHVDALLRAVDPSIPPPAESEEGDS